MITHANIIRMLDKVDRVHVRIAAIRKDDQIWQAHTILVDVFPNIWLNNWDEQSLYCSIKEYYYHYKEAIFISRIVDSEVVQTWLGVNGRLSMPNTDGTSGTIARMFDFEALFTQHDQWSSQDHSSHFDSGYGKMPWPHSIYVYSFTSNPQPVPWGQLANINNPFFPSFGTAHAMLFDGETDMGRGYGHQFPNPAMVIRIVRSEAYIHEVRFSPIALAVDVFGTNVFGTQLAINGSSAIQNEQILMAVGTSQFPLPQQLPPQIWVTLIQGDQLLDQVVLDQRMTPFTKTPPHIIVSRGDDFASRVEGLRYRGEGPTTEFKESVPSKVEHWTKTIAAFANAEGGVILFGIQDNTADLVGLKDSAGKPLTTGAIAELSDKIMNMIRNNVFPPPPIQIESGKIEHRAIIAIHVGKGTEQLYGLGANEPIIYVRRGANTFQARREELIALSHPPQPLMFPSQ